MLSVCGLDAVAGLIRGVKIVDFFCGEELQFISH